MENLGVISGRLVSRQPVFGVSKKRASYLILIRADMLIRRVSRIKDKTSLSTDISVVLSSEPR